MDHGAYCHVALHSLYSYTKFHSNKKKLLINEWTDIEISFIRSIREDEL